MTRLFGVIGHPISHSLSPVMHTAAFTALHLDALYSPFEVPAAILKPILKGLLAAGVEGLNVTVPLKETVVPLMDHLDVTAQAIGAVNTIVIRRQKTIGYNTDVVGFRRVLVEDLRYDCRGKTVLLLGAGGAARAVGWALVGLCPKRIWIVNRTYTKAKHLVRDLCRATALYHSPRRIRWGMGFAALPLDALTQVMQEVDVLVNATSLGLYVSDPIPVVPSSLHKNLVVVDLIYHRDTPLLKAARRRCAVAIGGLSMLLYQGVESLRLWLRRPAPIEAMRRALVRVVNKVSG